jgi:hypothetical protein
MPTYAVHDGSAVLNVIVADTLEIAEAVTGLSALASDGVPWIGWTLHDDKWRPPMPTSGAWEWDANADEWREIIPSEDASAQDAPTEREA